MRTMSDGSLPRMFLRPGNFNSALPPSEVLKVSFCRTHLWWFPNSVMDPIRFYCSSQGAGGQSQRAVLQKTSTTP